MTFPSTDQMLRAQSAAGLSWLVLTVALLVGVPASCDARSVVGAGSTAGLMGSPDALLGVSEIQQFAIAANGAEPVAHTGPVPAPRGGLIGHPGASMSPRFLRDEAVESAIVGQPRGLADLSNESLPARSSVFPVVIGHNRMSILIGAGLARRDPRSNGFQGLVGAQLRVGPSTALRLDGFRAWNGRTAKNSTIRLGLTLTRRPGISVPTTTDTASPVYQSGGIDAIGTEIGTKGEAKLFEAPKP
ncbi:MAG: hypothetical protein ABIZ71_13135 [Gemmatimonadales bacterium]